MLPAGGSVLLWGWLGVQSPLSPSAKQLNRLSGQCYVCLILVIWIAAFWWLLLHLGTTWINPLGTTARFRWWRDRTMYFLEGLSPLVPVFFVLLAYYLWSLNNLHRLSMIVTRVSLCIPKDNASATQLAEMSE